MESVSIQGSDSAKRRSNEVSNSTSGALVLSRPSFSKKDCHSVCVGRVLRKLGDVAKGRSNGMFNSTADVLLSPSPSVSVQQKHCIGVVPLCRIENRLARVRHLPKGIGHEPGC